jgi:release factor glutamine methyltransferase
MPKTYSEIYIDARKKLREIQVAASSLEARIIVACAAEKTSEELIRDMRLYAPSGVLEKTEAMTARRLRGEPVAYITGEWEFFGLPMTITRDVLIPRADTEVLAQTAINALRGRKMDGRVMDLCTGSGCVGCAIAKELPATHVVLVDNSSKALAVARHNVIRNKLNPRVTCTELDVRVSPPMMLGSFDVMVCNPPYIPSRDIEGLDTSVKDYEPLVALDGGEDGLDFYRDVVTLWRGVVRHGGLLMFECGQGQADSVAKLMSAAGYRNVGMVKDTQGIDRVIFGNA